MKRFELRNDGNRDIAFTGELISEVDSRDFRRSPGVSTRWTELRLYRTKGGKYVCELCGRSSMYGEADRFDITVTDREGLFEVFRDSYLSKALFEEAGFKGNLREVE